MLHMMTLTKRGKHVARDVSAIHGLISDSLGREPHQWADPRQGKIIIRSNVKPAIIGGYIKEVQSLEESPVEDGDNVQFSLLGHTVTRNGKTETPIRDDSDGRLTKWLHTRVTPAMRVTGLNIEPLSPVKGTRWGKRIVLCATAYAGVGVVENAELVNDLLRNGVGRAKRFGFGLLIVGRTS